MKSLLLNLIVVFSCAILLTACGEKAKDPVDVTPETPPSVAFKLIGTWNVLFSADDENENRQLEEDEKEILTDNEEMLLQFQSDGTGLVSSKFKEPATGNVETDENKFGWVLLENDTKLQIVSEYVDSFGTEVIVTKDTSILTIRELTATIALLENNESYSYNNTDTTYYTNWLGLEKLK